MGSSLKSLNKRLFNTIYVEEAAYGYTITREMLQKYPDCPVIPIRHYKDVFNRTNQHYAIQKQYPSLILAVKGNQFLYKGPAVCQDFGHSGHSAFYYTSFLLNCIFNCEYCYLQGMYPSANIVAFVNVEDFKFAMEQAVMKEPVFLAISYDTDLIGFHNIIPYYDYFCDFFASHSELYVEIRTKSANQTFYQNHTPLENIIIAFTLSPEEVIQKYERHTPALEMRIKAVQVAIKHGFKVRICFDPIFIHPELDNLYEPFFHYIFTQIDPGSIQDIGYGFFRMSKHFFKRIEKHQINSQLFSEKYWVDKDVVSYSPELQEKIKSKHFGILTQYVKETSIVTI
ncbi:MAG TPA: DNA photolyase [Clostridiales bacterium]|nr:DNA photolyase [Clostridiales bacterium]